MRTLSHDALMTSCFFLAGIHVHAPGMLSRDPCSEHGHCRRHAHLPFMQSEMVTPGTYHDTYMVTYIILTAYVGAVEEVWKYQLTHLLPELCVYLYDAHDL